MKSKDCLFSQVVFKSSGAAAHPVPHVFTDIETFHHWYELNKERIVTAVISPAPMYDLTPVTRISLQGGVASEELSTYLSPAPEPVLAPLETKLSFDDEKD